MALTSTDVERLAETTMKELFQEFPLPIALLQDSGGVLALNDHFQRDYGMNALQTPPLRAMIERPVPGWQTVRVPREGQEIDTKAQVLRVQGKLMLVLDDATEPDLLKELDQLHTRITELERLSSTDRLTGAWNRAHLDRVIVSELDRGTRFRQPVTIVLFDIDHFKRVNDTFGHLVGDSVLRELVEVVNGCIRSADILFRWGGEEFVVVAASTGYRAATALAEKIRARVDEHVFAHVGSVTVSLGVAEYMTSESVEVWFQRVDAALYTAKDSGRNRVSIDARGNSDLWATEGGQSLIRLVWQEAYECGEPTIDAQHRELFDLANTLFDVSFRPDATGASAEALDRLLAHISRHFVDEERLLAEHGYPQLESHRRAHSALLARARDLKASVAAGTTTFGGLVDFMANTVVAQHLFRVDREFYPLFKVKAG